MKLSQLMKSIEPIQIYPVTVQGTRRRAQEGDQRADKSINEHPARCAMPYAELPDPDVGSIHYRAQEVQPGGDLLPLKAVRPTAITLLMKRLNEVPP